MNIILLISGLLIFFFFVWFAIVSLIEKELMAFKRSLTMAIIAPLPFFFFLVVPFPGNILVEGVFLAGLILVFVILLLPIKGNHYIGNDNPTLRYDERDTMFSRKEITRIPELQSAYYKNNPEKQNLDKEWQRKMGLMSEKSSMYSPLTFTAANASFFPIELLRSFVDGEVNPNKKEFEAEKLSKFISNWAKKVGAISVGYCEMKDYHFYSIRGRGEKYNEKVVPKHKFGIALTVEMDKDFLAMGPAGPTLMESASQYLNSGLIAIQLAKFIRDLGYEACAHIDGNYEVICPLVARDSGLGEIGRMGLLMSPELGPRIRIAVITTNAPLQITPRKPDYSVRNFCGICKKCADVCPSQAIPKSKIGTIDGVKRWQINQEKCFSYWCTTGTDCGRCMSVCPYSHPNNLLHNMVRWGIKNNCLFQKIALFMDDYFYGRKPKPTKVPEWMS